MSTQHEPRLGHISAVVCNFNGESYLAACLEALFAQEPPLDEILVVDNGSSDGSVELLRRYVARGVKLLRLPFNGGPCVARNAGMRAARNRWVLAVDNDAVLRPDVTRRLREALESQPQAIAAQPRSVYYAEPQRVHYDGARFHYLGLFALRNFGRPLAEAEGQGTLEVDGLIAITVLLDREQVLATGGYDEDFFILFEDYDLSLRLRILGHVILSVEEAIVLHRGGTPGISFRGTVYPKIRAYYHSQNRWLLLLKNYRWRTLVAAAPGILLYELAWSLFNLQQGHYRANVSGKLGFLRHLPGALRRRRVLQRARRNSDRSLLVGGPLTLSPQLVSSRSNQRLAAVLDTLVRGWWKLARNMAG